MTTIRVNQQGQIIKKDGKEIKLPPEVFFKESKPAKVTNHPHKKKAHQTEIRWASEPVIVKKAWKKKKEKKSHKQKEGKPKYDTILHVDGGCRSNGQPHATGVAVVATTDGTVIAEREVLPNMSYEKARYEIITNNICEAEAIRMAVMEGFYKDKPITIVTDSTLVMNLVNLKWRSKTPNLSQAILAVLFAIDKRKEPVQVIWKPRDKNKAGIYIENEYGL